MACDCESSEVSGNTESNIPSKIGVPFSTACERATIIGAIPEVIRHPGFTLVRGATVENRVSSGGITNMTSFFKSRAGCFYNKNAQLAGCADCA